MSNQTQPPVMCKATGAIAIATINRPERRNALNIAAYRGLIDFIRQSEADPAIRAMVITGADGHFTSGNDLADFAAAKTPEDVKVAIHFLLAISGAEKPVVAAIEGHAVGIGTTMLLHCDFAHAARDAQFRLPFITLGLTPEGGSSLLLPAIAGAKRAAELLLLGEAFTAETARESGLLTSITEPGQALDAAMTTAGKLAALPAEGLRLSKQLLRRGMAQATRETIEHEARIFAERLTSPEAQEAFMRFFAGKK